MGDNVDTLIRYLKNTLKASTSEWQLKAHWNQ